MTSTRRILSPHPIPVLDSEWRVLFRPEKTGCYINDHSLVRSADGKWHLFGITQLGESHNPEMERYFAHGSGDTLSGDAPWVEHGSVCNDGTRAWAPGAVAHEGRYFMFYGPSPTKLCVSRDLFHWMGEPVVMGGAPCEAAHRDHMVYKLEDSTWLLYATGLDEKGMGAISVFVSHDLINWHFVRYALRTSGDSALRPAWGATESPFVFFREGWFYLSITYTDCQRKNYQDTVIFCSVNPFDFGVFDADRPEESVVQRFKAHAPEYVYDEKDGHWYMTTCGWPGFDIPHEGAVSVARIAWN